MISFSGYFGKFHSSIGPVASINLLIYQYCRILRTPTEDIWPGVTQLSDYKATFPNWMTNSLDSQVKTLDTDGLELLQSMLTYDPVYRISARAVLQHPYFNDLDTCKIPAA